MRHLKKLMRSKLIEEVKKDLKLNDLQRSILVGLILGDGHLETFNGGRTYRLKVEHSIRQKEYLDWLYSKFKNLTHQEPKLKLKNDKPLSYWFTTYSLGIFRFYGQQFYAGRKKIIPKIIEKLLDPIALAIWFMDDGSLKSNHHKTYIIHSIGYSIKDLKLIKEALKKRFGMVVNLHKQYDRKRIYVTSNSAEKFRELVRPYIVPSLMYKLGNTMPKR